MLKIFDVAVAMGLSDLGGILTLKEQKMALMAFPCGQNVFD